MRGRESNFLADQRLGLHAWTLGFPHAVTNQELRFESPMPTGLARLV